MPDLEWVVIADEILKEYNQHRSIDDNFGLSVAFLVRFGQKVGEKDIMLGRWRFSFIITIIMETEDVRSFAERLCSLTLSEDIIVDEKLGKCLS